MPQFQQDKKGLARIKVISADATRAYLLLMRSGASKLQALPDDIFVVEEKMLPLLQEHKIPFEIIEK